MKTTTLLAITTLILAITLVSFAANSPTGSVVLDIEDTDFESFFEEPQGGIIGITGAFGIATNGSNTDGGVNITLNKTENADPANISDYFVYRILVNNTGDTNAFNMSVIDTYPAQVRYNHSAPVATGTLNDTFLIGNLSNRTAFQINITVLLINISNGTLINNTANVSYLNSSGQNLSVAVTENTTASSATLLPCLGTITTSTTLTADLIASDVDEDCITLGAAGIKLDCQNHTLYGFNGTGFGVRAPGADGLEVMQCRIMNFLDGIFSPAQ